MSFLMHGTSHYVDYMNFFLILSEMKNWQVCYLRVVTFAVTHYIANLPNPIMLRLILNIC
jgi:hypothetical protein